MFLQKTFMGIFALGLVAVNPLNVLAERTKNFAANESFYPDSCEIAFEGEVYGCSYVNIGIFNDLAGNIQLCSRSDCFVLILSSVQIENIANRQDFNVRELAWQSGNEILKRWRTSMRCRLGRSAIGCIGSINGDNPISIYIR